jgi:hypothetical protein
VPESSSATLLVVVSFVLGVGWIDQVRRRAGNDRRRQITRRLVAGVTLYRPKLLKLRRDKRRRVLMELDDLRSLKR